MAKKKASKKAAKAVTKRTAKTTAKRGMAAAPRRMAAKRVSAAASRESASTLRSLESLLEEHGMPVNVHSLVLEPRIRAAGDCPPGTIRRMVCRRGPDGRIVCQDECVPL